MWTDLFFAVEGGLLDEKDRRLARISDVMTVEIEHGIATLWRR